LVYETLRRLCLEHPHHDNLNVVCGKLWLIGRTYATQIERRIKSDGTQGSALWQLSTLVLKDGRKIDEWINELPSSEERLTPELAPVVLRVHGKFLHALKPLTKGHGARSFVSKYLHFHRPVVPIYDSVANAAVTKLVRWDKQLGADQRKLGGDEQYRWFIQRLLKLQEQLRAAGVDTTVRNLDWFLSGML
jgi:hypothetical protein